MTTTDDTRQRHFYGPSIMANMEAACRAVAEAEGGAR